MWVADDVTNASEGAKSGRARANVPIEYLDPFPRHVLALAEDIGEKVAERRAALARLPPPTTTPQPPPERPGGVAAWARKLAPTDDVWRPADSANSANNSPNAPSDDVLDGRVDLRGAFPYVYCVDAARTEFRDDAVSIDVENSRVAVIASSSPPDDHMMTT